MEPRRSPRDPTTELTYAPGVAERGPYRGASPAVRWLDERDRAFDTDFFGDKYDLHVDLARQYGLGGPFFAPIKAGITETRVLAFEVPPTVQRLRLVSTATPCAGS